MKGIKILGKVEIMIFLLAACNPTSTIQPSPLATIAEVTALTPTDTAIPTKPPQMATIVPMDTKEPSLYPLSEPGPYKVGIRTYSFTDAARNGRGVDISVYYPAVPPTDSTGIGSFRDANPDSRNAPYPLILSSTVHASYFARYVVSYGFVWVGIDKIDSYLKMNEGMIDQPLDILFALNQVASSPLESLAGMIDAEHAGVTGYSFDGYNTLALSGARIDPEYYLAQCPDPDPTTQAILGLYSAFDCVPADAWDEFSTHAGQAITASQDGLWQPMTDERIRAVLPMAGEGWWLFGERGLAAVDRPTLMIAATQDELYAENALIFEHLGTSDKAFISFIGQGHVDMINNPKMIARMAHFTVAFFGYHLQDREDFAEYFSEDFVAQHDDLVWGVYMK